jgi:hypothetical protein
MAERSPRTSVEAYLEVERTSDSKHEYFDGLVIDVAGASPRDNMISTNVMDPPRGLGD